MKKTISILLCLLLIFSSVNLSFANDWSTTDQTNLQNIKNALYNGGAFFGLVSDIKTYTQWLYNNAMDATQNSSVVSSLSSIANYTYRSSERLNTVITNTQNINNNLVTLMGWLDPSNNNSLSGILNQILNTLVHTNAGGVVVSWLSDIYSIQTTNLPKLTDIYNIEYANLPKISDIYTAQTSFNTFFMTQSSFNSPALYRWNSDGSFTNYSYYEGANNGSLAYQLVNGIKIINNNTVAGFSKLLNSLLIGYNSQQAIVSFADLDSTLNFTPLSGVDGIYKYLNALNTPLARLAYVHASDEEIEAREKATANQTAVVNNFIDSNGSGAAPASSFGNVASMSSGYTSNMNTDAQASGIWNIFNSNNFGWFSQETANQLDTTTASTRKGSYQFETPLLDQQIEDIYKELGVDVND